MLQRKTNALGLKKKRLMYFCLTICVWVWYFVKLVILLKVLSKPPGRGNQVMGWNMPVLFVILHKGPWSTSHKTALKCQLNQTFSFSPLTNLFSVLGSSVLSAKFLIVVDISFFVMAVIVLLTDLSELLILTSSSLQVRLSVCVLTFV